MSTPMPPQAAQPRDAAVSVVVDRENDNLPITTVLVSGRPSPHPFAGGEGRHTTAWVVYVDTVRRLLVGMHLAAAAATVQQLITDETSFNAGSLGTARARRRTDAIQAATVAATTAVTAAGQLADPNKIGSAITSLQEAIAKYLTLRNLAPLAGAFFGANQAPGGGEAAALVILRAFECKDADYAPAAVQAPLLKLLDVDTLAWLIQGNAAEATMPGRLDDNAATVWTVVQRHLQQVANAYPLCYAASGLSDITTVHGLIKNCHVSLGGLAQPAFALPPVNNHAAPAPVGWASTAGTGGCTVTLTLSPDHATVTGVHAPERGKTLLAAQGHHLTAHITVVCAVEHAVKSKPLTDACTDLLQLVNDLEQLPIFPPKTDGVPVVQFKGDPKGRLTIAWNQLVEAKEQAQQVEPGMHAIVIQDLASAYLSVRNLLPLATVNHGSIPATHGETVKRLREMEQSGTVQAAQVAQARTDLWRLFDSAMIGHILDPPDLNDVAPGADRNGLKRLADALKVHLITAKAAWPICCAQAGLETQWSVYDLLSTSSVLIDTDALFGLLPGMLPGVHMEFVQLIGEQQADPTVHTPPSQPPSSPSLSSQDELIEDDLGYSADEQSVDEDNFIVADDDNGEPPKKKRKR